MLMLKATLTAKRISVANKSGSLTEGTNKFYGKTSQKLPKICGSSVYRNQLDHVSYTPVSMLLHHHIPKPV